MIRTCTSYKYMCGPTILADSSSQYYSVVCFQVSISTNLFGYQGGAE